MRENEASATASAVLIDGVADWLMSQALGDGDVRVIVAGCCDRLLAAGIPLWRGFVSFRILHPKFASVSVIWRRDEQSGTVEHIETLHGDAFSSEDWRQSPMNHMLSTQIPFLRRRLKGEEALLDFPVCRELRDQGGSDYVAWMIPFARDDDPGPHLDGVIGSWATDRPSGFSDGEIRSLVRIQRRLVVSLKVQIKQQIAHTVLATYLGRDAGRQVLDGQIKRGDGEMVHAIIWYSDMRDSTRLADSMAAEEFLQTLNSYFECTAGAVLANGGEVLRFIGDAVLAIFPIRDHDPQSACELAMAAAGDAASRLQALNEERAGHDLEALDYGLGLHVGDVMFGNIGVQERLEFSVIGPAANEVARIESLTKTLGHRALASVEFARCMPRRFESAGKHTLKGVGAPLEVVILE
ncbi:MAG: adenylate/guanylate cyclase domain-containing protein [Gammaproteobacteria bacterium]|jgi:adenylate cyclase|nr:adenylate/guanylate cyclase domain-containing protein [Gammaproteobacteria bacterium]